MPLEIIKPVLFWDWLIFIALLTNVCSEIKIKETSVRFGASGMKPCEKGEKQREAIVQHIITCVKTKGYPPSVREIAEAVGLKSSSTAQHYLVQLEENGYINEIH